MTATTRIRTILDAKGREVHSISPQATVFEAIGRMADTGVGALLVMDGDRLAGIISERDYTRKVILMGRSSKEERVEEIMTSSVITATPDHTVEQAMRLMTEHRIRHLPILDAGRIAGVVSIGDLVKWIISEQEETIAHLTNYISGRY